MNNKSSPRLFTGARKNLLTHSKAPSRDEVKQAAQGRWKEILASLGIPAGCLVNRHGPCPACGGKDRFRFDDKRGDGGFFCSNCGPGDGLDLVMHCQGLGFRKALDAVASVIGLSGRPTLLKPLAMHKPAPEFSKEKPNQKAKKYIDWLWSSSRLITVGSPADLYLKSRCVGFDDYPKDLRWHEGLHYLNDERVVEGTFPVLVAAVRNAEGELIAIHRTYLTWQGDKAPVSKPKKLSTRIYGGALKGSAIKLYQPEGSLCVAEGIETALSAVKLWGVPAWATISAHGLREAIIPRSVEHVIIAVDNDSHKTNAGLLASRALAARMQQEGRTTQLVMPDSAGQDLNDVLKECN